MTLIPVLAIGDKALEDIDRTLENAVEEATRAPRRFPVYVASTMHHRGMWKHYRRLWASQGVRIVSSWIDCGDDHDRQSPLHYGGAWISNVREITEAKALLCFGSGKDILRGALVEAGVAIGQHKPVIIIDVVDPIPGHPRWGTWQYHPLVHYAASPEDALSILRTWNSLGARP